MKIKVSNFLAMFPKIHPSKLKDTAAAVAKNLDVTSGVIRPFYKTKFEKKLTDFGTFIQDIRYFSFPDKDGFFQFPSYVDLTYSPIADDQYRRVYWSGDSRGNGHILYSYTPLLTAGETFNPRYWYKLGIPAPTQPPLIQSHSTSYTEDEQADLADEARIYVYTYVTEIGEESAPSPASAMITLPHDKSIVKLTGLYLDPDASSGRNIKKKRIYRSLTNSSGTADLYFVAEIDAAIEEFEDKLDGSDVNTADSLPSIAWDAPRTGLSGLGVTAKGVNYAFYEKTACFSEPYYPYAWPRDYEITVQYDIVAMGHFENYIIVATKSTPYLISGIDPSTTTVQELPLNEACISKRSMVSMATCVCYASPNGIVMAYGATAKLISEAYFDKDTWTALNPKSIHAVEYRGKYLFFYENGNDKGAYIFDPLQIDFGITKLDFWFKAATRHHQTEKLFFLDTDNNVHLLDDTISNRLPFTWRSKVFDVGGEGARMLAAKVVADNYNDLNIKIFCDNKLLYQKKLINNRSFRLPNHSKHTEWQIELSGTSSVRDIVLAETMVELSK